MTKIFKLFDYENCALLCFICFIALDWIYDTKAFFFISYFVIIDVLCN